MGSCLGDANEEGEQLLDEVLRHQNPSSGVSRVGPAKEAVGTVQYCTVGAVEFVQPVCAVQTQMPRSRAAQQCVRETKTRRSM